MKGQKYIDIQRLYEGNNNKAPQKGALEKVN